MPQPIPSFLTEIIKTSRDIWSKGWAEANAGNISLRLVRDAVDMETLRTQPREWTQLGTRVPDLAGEYFLVTGSGRYLRNIELYPEKNVGILELNDAGSAYRIIWGFQPTGGPTSELMAHLRVHGTRKRVTNGIDRAVIHTHSPDLIALTHVMPLDTRKLTRLLWEMMPECIVAFPEGIEVIPWALPGTSELADATATALVERRMAVWQFHGVIAVGRNLDAAFGLIDTAEKSASLHLKARSGGGVTQKLSKTQLKKLARHFRVVPNPDILS
jgi:rhamnulose-1-phosphate aldolase